MYRVGESLPHPDLTIRLGRKRRENMEEDSSTKRPCECGVEEEVVGKKPRTHAGGKVTDELEKEEDMLAWLTLDEQTVMEISNLLEPSEAAWSSALEQCNFKVKFIDNPYTSPVIVQSSTAYVTINGNEESCGSSFSESESSVMASVDRCCCVSVRSAVGECSGEFGDSGGAWSSDAMDTRGLVEGTGDNVEGFFVKEIDGCDWMETGFDVDLDDDDIWKKLLGNDLFGGSC